jgi:hypothetical protein
LYQSPRNSRIFRAMRTSVFHRLRWPRSSHHSASVPPPARKLVWRRKDRVPVTRASISNSKDKGKGPLIEEKPITVCEICASNNKRPPSCSKRSTCSVCKISGHLAFRCQARSAKTGKFFSQSEFHGKRAGFDGASSSKDPNCVIFSEKILLPGTLHMSSLVPPPLLGTEAKNLQLLQSVRRHCILL